MKLYLGIIFAACIVLIIINHFLIGFSTWLNPVAVISSVIAVIAVDGVIAALCHKAVNKMKPTGWFAVSKKEKSFWQKFGVRRFKDYLPDLGSLVKFPKGKIVDPNSPEYIYKYLQESCIGEIGHIIGAVVGFAVMFIFPQHILYVGLPVTIINFILCIMPVMALRYNRNTLLAIYARAKRTAQTKAAAAETPDPAATSPQQSV